MSEKNGVLSIYRKQGDQILITIGGVSLKLTVFKTANKWAILSFQGPRDFQINRAETKTRHEGGGNNDK